MKKSRVSVYCTRDLGDCTNDGVSSRHERMTLFYDCTRQEAVDYCRENGIDTDECLWLQHRQLFGYGHDYMAAIPLLKGKGCGPMMGGNFVYTSSSDLPRWDGWLHAPIPVHDRYETEEQYRAMSV